MGKGRTQKYPKPGVSTTSMMLLQSESNIEEVLKRMQEEIEDLKRDNSRIRQLLQTRYITKGCGIGKKKIAHSNSKASTNSKYSAARIRQKHYHLITGY